MRTLNSLFVLRNYLTDIIIVLKSIINQFLTIFRVIFVIFRHNIAITKNLPEAPTQEKPYYLPAEFLHPGGSLAENRLLPARVRTLVIGFLLYFSTFGLPGRRKYYQPAGNDVTCRQVIINPTAW